MAELLLGVDAGQTVTKAVLFDLSGRQVGIGTAQVATRSPRARWVERDMDEVWLALASAVRSCLSGFSPADVLAVGIAGHGDGLYPVDAELRAFRPAITAMDTRAHGLLAQWRADGTWDRALELTGTVPFAGSPAPLLAWLQREDPDVVERARWLLFCKDWLRLRLTGELATDVTDASASFTDVRAQAYSTEALKLFGLAGLENRLPPLAGSSSVAGEVTEEAAAATGLRAGTPVVVGAHDVDAAAVGLGASSPGQLSLIAGTFSINQVVSTSVNVDARWQARSFVRLGQWLNMGTSPASATNVEWFLSLVGLNGPSAYATAAAEVASVLGGRSEVVYLPFLYGSPHGDAASGTFLGVRGWHERPALLRGLFEGVVFNHRYHVEALREGFDVGPVVRLAGGVTRSDVWSQLFADALRMPVEVTDTDEAGARGAALLAGVGVGALDGGDLARVSRRYEPNAERGDVLDEAYATYRAAIAALGPVWQRLA
jgi:L-xylulokinase